MTGLTDYIMSLIQGLPIHQGTYWLFKLKKFDDRLPAFTYYEWQAFFGDYPHRDKK